ncbi:hypothetical protein BSKO_12665 [Bryopsis sp. KO-2023]|nr:hypothetical protein BSKO_12665 [Bryopsis sp. KO-2023]
MEEERLLKRQWSKTDSDLSLRELAEQSASSASGWRPRNVLSSGSTPRRVGTRVVDDKAPQPFWERSDTSFSPDTDRSCHPASAPKRGSTRYAEANLEEDYMDDFEEYSGDDRYSNESSGQNWLSLEELEVLRHSMATLNIMGWAPMLVTSCEGQESVDSAHIHRTNLPAQPGGVSGATDCSKLVPSSEVEGGKGQNDFSNRGDPLEQTQGNLEMLSIIANKAKQLDSEQKKALSKVLRKLKTAIDSGQELSELLSDMPGVSDMTKTDEQKLPSGSMDHRPCQQEVVILLMSAHNGGSDVGLTEVQLLDEHNSDIPILQDGITIDPAIASTSDPSVLINKKTRTVNDRDMWKGAFSREGGGHVGIRIRTRVGSKMLECVQIWNYNVSLKGLGKGAKNCQVFVDGLKLWSGEIKKGCGNTTFDYSTKILVGKSKTSSNFDGVTDACTHKSDIGTSRQMQGSLGSKEASLSPSERATRNSESFLSEACSGSEPASEVGALSDQDLLAELRRRKIDPDSSVKPSSLSNSPLKELETAGPGVIETEVGVPASRKPEAGKVGGICNDHPRMVSRRTTSSARRLGSPSPCFGKGASQSKPDASLSPATRAEQPNQPGGSNDSSGPIWLGGLKTENAPQPQPRKARPMSGRRASRDGPSHRLPQQIPERRGKPLEDTATSKAPSDRRGRKDRTLEESLDSIAFFQRNQAGRLNKPIRAAQPVVPESTAPIAVRPSSLELDDTFKDAREVMQNAIKKLGLRFGEAPPPPPDNECEGLGKIEPQVEVDPCDQGVDGVSTQDVQGAESKAEEHCSGLAANVVAALQSDQETQPPASKPMAFYGTDIPSEFVIPATPTGRILEIHIFSTWGDPHYVGLSGVEVFDSAGKMVVIEDAVNQVKAVPESINVLEEYDDDPRTPENLVDGVSMTCDDIHVWLAPFTPETPNVITVDLGRQTALGLIRLWNYNKSRIHTSRGARDVCLLVDGRPIFAGEINRAPGNVADAPPCAENLLFTDDEKALQAIDEFDERYNRAVAGVKSSAQDEPGEIPRTRHPVELVTGNDKDDPLGKAKAIPGSPRPEAEVRRLTHAQASVSSKHTPNTSSRPIQAKEIKIEILDTWGDPHYVGLTGIAMVDSEGASRSFGGADICGTPSDLNDIPGNTGDDRTLDKLLDGVNATSDDSHMWIAPIRRVLEQNDNAPPNEITITSRDGAFSFVRLAFWNYNKNLEDTYRGAKRVHLYMDGRRATPDGGLILRKAPGTGTFDFGQIVDLSIQSKPLAESEDEVALAWVNNTSNPALAQQIRRKMERDAAHLSLVRQMYITPLLPMGFVLKILIVCSWGDAEYVGLCGLEVHDALKGKLRIDPSHLFARPHSVCELPKMQADVRTPDKLVDGDNSGNPAHSWLAPKSFDDQPNVITILFDTPIMLSLIKIWNYVRTPERGASRVDIFLDDALVYAGGVKKASTNPTSDFAQAVIFTNDEATVESERHSIYDGGERDAVQMVNVDPGSAVKTNRQQFSEERPATALIQE